MPIDRAAFKKDLESILDENGTPCGRIQEYWNAESSYLEIVRFKQAGPILLFRAFQSLFLQTVGHMNGLWNSRCAKADLPFYKRNMVPRLVHCFQHLSAAELAATHGYPLSAFTILRNTFDNLILLLGAMQGIADFYAIEGTDNGNSLPRNEALNLRKRTESCIRRKITGHESGLSPTTRKMLDMLNDLFDFEVHGARLSFATAAEWVQGEGVLHVYPEYNETPANLFANRLSEVTWPFLRLLPLLQHSALVFPPLWATQWRILDGRFEDLLQEIAEHQTDKLSLAVIELVEAKLPFSDSSRYPLEGKSTTAA